MSILKNVYFISFILLYLFVQFCRHYKIYLPEIINSYFTDFLFMPLLLILTLHITRKIKRDNNIVFSIPMLLVAFLYVSFIFEYYFPNFNSKHTADKIDVVMYFFGTIFYYIIQKRNYI